MATKKGLPVAPPRSGGDKGPWRSFDAYELIAVIALAGPVLLLPWMNAGRDAWLQNGSLIGALVAFATMLVRSWRNRRPFPQLPWVVWILVAAVALGAAQMIPLPTSFAKRLSPASARLWIESLSVVPPDLIGVATAPQGEPSRLPISVYPRGTRGELADLVWLTILGFASAVTFRKPKAMLLLFGAIGLNGAALAVAATGVKLSQAVANVDTVAFGMMGNRNHASGYLNISLGCVLGLAIWQWLNRPSDEQRRQADLDEEEEGFDPPSQEHWTKTLLADASGPLPLVVLAAFVLALGVAMAESRGGWLTGLSIGVGAIVLLMFHRPAQIPVFGGGLVLLVLIGIGLVAWFGFDDRLSRRLDSLTTAVATGSDGRLLHWQDALRSAWAYAPAGCGMGAYRMAYVPFGQSLGNLRFLHAENQYIEALVCGGVLGLILLLSAISVSLWTSATLIRRSAAEPAFLVGAGALLALGGQVLQGCVDFGLYCPTNASLLAIVITGACGVALSASSAGGSRGRKQSDGPAPLGFAATLLVLGTLSAIWAGLGQHANERSNRALRDTDLAFSVPTAAPPEELIRRVRAIADADPDDVEIRSALAALLIQRFRLDATERLQAAVPKAPHGDVWAKTDPMNWHQLANTYRESGRADAWRDELRNVDYVVNHLPQAIESLEACHLHAAVAPWASLQLAQLAPLVKPVTAEWEERLTTVTRNRLGADAASWVRLGYIAAELGAVDAAAKDLTTAMRLDPRRIDPAIRAAQAYPALLESKEWAFPNDATLIARTMWESLSAPGDKALQDALLHYLKDQVAAGNLAPAKQAYVQGSIERVEGRLGEAVERYREAVALAPERLDWHIDFVKFLLLQNRRQEAHIAAREGLARFPNHVKLMELRDSAGQP